MATVLFLSRLLPLEIGEESLTTNTLEHRKERLEYFKNSFELHRDSLKTDDSLLGSSSFLYIGALINEIGKNNEFPDLVEMAEPISSTLAEVINYNSTKKELLEALELFISKIDELLQSQSTTAEESEEASSKAGLNRVGTDTPAESTITVVILLGENYPSRCEAFESLISHVTLAMDDLSNAKERNHLCIVLDELYSFINSLCNEDELAEFQNDFKSILSTISKVSLSDMSRAELVNILAQLTAKFESIVAEELEKEAHDKKVEDVKNLLLTLSEHCHNDKENWFMRLLASKHAEEIANMVDFSEYPE